MADLDLLNPCAIDLPPNVPPDRVIDFDVWKVQPRESNYHQIWEDLAKAGLPEMVWSWRNGGHWIATSADAVTEILSDHTRFSARSRTLPKSIGAGFVFIPSSLDPPEHRPFRALLNGNFTPSQITPFEDQFLQIATELTEAVRLKGHCDFKADFADYLPAKIFMAIMDLPIEDVPKLRNLAVAINQWDGQKPIQDVMAEVFSYLQPFIDARRGKKGNDLISRVINSEINGAPMPDAQALELCGELTVAGLDTVTSFLTFSMMFLARSPEIRKQVSADLTLIPKVMEELFRRFGIVTILREARMDMTYRGVDLKEGDMLVTPTALAGYDETKTKCPFDFSLDRGRPKHVAFGAGNHRCPGEFLARTEIRLALEVWLARIPEFDIDPESKMTFISGFTPLPSGLGLVWDPATTRPRQA